MSRSYRKISYGKMPSLGPAYGDVLSYVNMSIPDWSGIRMKEKTAIHNESANPEYGEAVFPKYRRLDRSSWFSIPRRHPLAKKYIRDKYFTEIRNILNGYKDYREQLDESFDESFIEEYNKIKGLIIDDGRKHKFEWLTLKPVRKVIKAWTGEPFEALKCLTDNGFIEQAVRREFKLISAK